MTFFTQKVKGQLHHDDIISWNYLLIWTPRNLYESSSLPGNQHRGPSVPLVVDNKLIVFADIELQVIVVEPCDQALYQSSVLLCKNSL